MHPIVIHPKEVEIIRSHLGMMPYNAVAPVMQFLDGKMAEAARLAGAKPRVVPADPNEKQDAGEAKGETAAAANGSA